MLPACRLHGIMHTANVDTRTLFAMVSRLWAPVSAVYMPDRCDQYALTSRKNERASYCDKYVVSFCWNARLRSSYCGRYYVIVWLVG